MGSQGAVRCSETIALPWASCAHLVGLERNLHPHLSSDRLVLERLQPVAQRGVTQLSRLRMWRARCKICGGRRSISTGGCGDNASCTHLYHWSTVWSWTNAGLIWTVPRKACSWSERSYTLKVMTDCSEVTSLFWMSNLRWWMGGFYEHSQGDLVFPHRIVSLYTRPKHTGCEANTTLARVEG